MASNGSPTYFNNQNSSLSGPTDYIKDVFPDVTLVPSNNTGLTSNANTNPLSEFFADTDQPRYGYKKLYIKDYVLIDDTSKWINGAPTYRVIFNEHYAGTECYIYGNKLTFAYDGVVAVNVQLGGGVSIVGKHVLAGIIVAGSTAASSTAAVTVDGVSTGVSVDYSSVTGNITGINYTVLAPNEVKLLHSTTKLSNDLHNVNFAPNNASMRLIGIFVVTENSGANYQFNPGTTYVNKTKVATSVGATAALPTFGSSLGGVDLLYKTSAGAYTVDSASATTVVSIAQGSSGTNLLSVSAGHGSSFPAGSGVIVGQGGGSFYVGVVTNVSTDTLTVYPTLSFGISNAVYRSYTTGVSASIGTSYYILSETINFNNYLQIATSNINPITGTGWWTDGASLQTIATSTASQAEGKILGFGASGSLTLQGYFSAADVVFAEGNTGFIHFTLGINGLPSNSLLGTQTSSARRTIVKDLGPGFNSLTIGIGATSQVEGIKQINLYTRAYNQGITYGLLASVDTLNAFADRSAINATMIAFGTKQRHYAYNMSFNGGWLISGGVSLINGAAFTGSSSNTGWKFGFYGNQYAILGTAPTGGTLTLDGTGIGLTFNVVRSASTEGFHTLSYTGAAGVTISIMAVDVLGSKKDISPKINQYGYNPNGILSFGIGDTIKLTATGSSAVASDGSEFRTWSLIKDRTGDSIGWDQNSVSGDVIRANADGVYYFNYMDAGTGTLLYIIRNEYQINVVTPNVVGFFQIPSGVLTSVTATVKLKRGDCVRFHHSGGGTMDANGFLIVTRVA